ncbi:MAG: hypothetical protein IK096_01185, partial [Lachnospiraceae bacterium]|nr:hypothetical protein [Lachnospiraceae bacterium]
MLGKLKKWILKPSGIEGESDNLLFLTRYLLLLFMAHTIFIGVVTAISGLRISAIVAFVVMALYHIAFQLTYRISISNVATGVSIVSAFYFTCFAINYGWRCSFQLLFFVILCYLWYDIAWDTGWKIFFSVVVIGLFSLISILSPVGMTLLSRTDPLLWAIVYVNIFFSFVSISIILYFFCTQFAEAERKLYLYNR